MVVLITAFLCVGFVPLSYATAQERNSQQSAGEITAYKPLPVEEVAPGVFFAEGQVALANPENLGGVSNAGFIVGSESVAVIDTGGSYAIGMRLKAALRARTKLPVRYVINTHMHPDHIFGNAAFEDEKPVFAGHHKLARAVNARGQHYFQAFQRLIGEKGFAGTSVVAPTLLVAARTEIDLGGRTIELTPYSTAHTDNDLTVRDLATRTLFTGDLLFVRHLPVLDGNLKGWLAVSDELAKVDVTLACPGHGALQKSWPGALDAQRQYLTRLRDDVRAALKAGRSLKEASESIPVESPANWALHEDYHRRNITAGYAELEWE